MDPEFDISVSILICAEQRSEAPVWAAGFVSLKPKICASLKAPGYGLRPRWARRALWGRFEQTAVRLNKLNDFSLGEEQRDNHTEANNPFPAKSAEAWITLLPFVWHGGQSPEECGMVTISLYCIVWSQRCSVFFFQKLFNKNHWNHPKWKCYCQKKPHQNPKPTWAKKGQRRTWGKFIFSFSRNA